MKNISLQSMSGKKEAAVLKLSRKSVHTFCADITKIIKKYVILLTDICRHVTIYLKHYILTKSIR